MTRKLNQLDVSKVFEFIQILNPIVEQFQEWIFTVGLPFLSLEENEVQNDPNEICSILFSSAKASGFAQIQLEQLNLDTAFCVLALQIKILNHHNINAYDYFIEHFKKISFPGQTLEKHHILPKHAGGGNEPSNLIKIPFLEHALLHFVRMHVHNDSGDRVAWYFMRNDTVNGRKERIARAKQLGIGAAFDPKIREQLKNSQRSAYYDPKIQRQNGMKTQQSHKLSNKAFYNSNVQRQLGLKGAATNRSQGTGGFDSKNIAKARETQKQKKSGRHNSKLQRELLLRRHGLWIQGKHYQYSPDVFAPGQAVPSQQKKKIQKFFGEDYITKNHLSELFVAYYLEHGNSQDFKKP